MSGSNRGKAPVKVKLQNKWLNCVGERRLKMDGVSNIANDICLSSRLFFKVEVCAIRSLNE